MTKENNEITLKLSVPAGFIFEVLENLPEYSLSFEVIEFDYEGCRFDLEDYETGLPYTLTKPKVLEGFIKLFNEVIEGKFAGLAISDQNIFDPANWDAYCVDALIQMSVLGKVIYG